MKQRLLILCVFALVPLTSRATSLELSFYTGSLSLLNGDLTVSHGSSTKVYKKVSWSGTPLSTYGSLKGFKKISFHRQSGVRLIAFMGGGLGFGVDYRSLLVNVNLKGELAKDFEALGFPGGLKVVTGVVAYKLPLPLFTPYISAGVGMPFSKGLVKRVGGKEETRSVKSDGFNVQGTVGASLSLIAGLHAFAEFRLQVVPISTMLARDEKITTTLWAHSILFGLRASLGI